MNSSLSVSLTQQVKKAITNRISICFLVLIFTAFLFAIYDVVNSVSMLKESIDVKCLNLKNFIISQALIDNEPGIQTQLDQVNQADNSIEFKFVSNKVAPYNKAIHWIPLWRWEYYFPITLGETNLGYIRAVGSFGSDKQLLYQFLLLITILIIFSSTMFFLLYPLAKNIPQLLFITPIHDLLALLKNKENRHEIYISPSSFLEINEISKEIFALFNEIQVKTREAAIGQVAAQVAHDIRSPLAALQALTEQQLPEIEESKRILLRNAVYQIRDIVNNLDHDAFPKKRTVTQIAILLEYALSERRAALGNKNISINQRIDIAAYGFFVNVLPPDIISVLTNIINNAIESIEAEHGMIDVHLYQEADNIVISIQDNGVGIPPAIREALFQRGFTTKKTGSGLGLFHAKQTVSQWGGSIDVCSIVGEGTTIRIALPAQPAPPWFIAQLSIAPHSIVACVDDSISLWDAWQERFKLISNDVQLRYCKDKAELLRELGIEQARPCTYLVDYEFSGQSYTGLDLIEKVLSYKKPVDQVFLVTSRTTEDIKEFCVENKICLISKFFALKIPIKIIK